MNDQVTAWMNGAGRYDLLTDEQLFELCKKRDAAPEGSKAYIKAVNEICLRNMRLVIPLAKSMGRKAAVFSLSGPNAADMLQHGFLGLRRAAEKYDHTRGYKFSTYAQPWIRQAIQRWATSSQHTIYIPESTVREINIRKTNGNKPSGNAGAPKNENVLAAGNRAMNVCSIDVRMKEEEDGTIVDILSEENSINFDGPGGKRCLSLGDAMAKAGIPPRVQDLMNAYSQRGNMVIAANRAGWPVKEAPAVIRATIAKLQELA